MRLFKGHIEGSRELIAQRKKEDRLKMTTELLITLSAFGFLLIFLAIFSIRQMAFGRTHTARVQKDGGSPLLGGTFLMEFAYWAFTPIGRFLASTKISPNMISGFCLLFSIAAGVVFATGNFVLAGWVWFLGSIMDALDGLVARVQNRMTEAGAVIDSTVDRVAEFSIFFGLAIYYRESLAHLLLVLMALMGSLLTSYITAKGDILRIKLPRGVMRRAERAVYLGAAALFSPLVAQYVEPNAVVPTYHLMVGVLILIAVFSNASAIYRVFWLYRKLKKNS